jgi:hypothetical protein
LGSQWEEKAAEADALKRAPTKAKGLTPEGMNTAAGMEETGTAVLCPYEGGERRRRHGDGGGGGRAEARPYTAPLQGRAKTDAATAEVQEVSYWRMRARRWRGGAILLSRRG